MSDLLPILSSIYDASFDQNEREQRLYCDQNEREKRRYCEKQLLQPNRRIDTPKPTGYTQPAMVHHCDDGNPTTMTSVSGISLFSDASMALKVITYRKYELKKKAAIHGLHIALFTQLCRQYEYYYIHLKDVAAKLLDDKREITRLLEDFVTKSGSFFELALRDLVFLEKQLQRHMSNDREFDGVCHKCHYT